MCVYVMSAKASYKGAPTRHHQQYEKLYWKESTLPPQGIGTGSDKDFVCVYTAGAAHCVWEVNFTLTTYQSPNQSTMPQRAPPLPQGILNENIL